ncbi:hypothetical protein LTR84_003521 [Exophiala bonariae]|uniref:BZIP domain-containing protein n=1 Tax=Exophiala bonariae TaxID=1690606 RepID=A0AAV9N7F8_9EURO|nr:hypothetical protein LTR84_003521 [Exophiala bonariae]
MANSESSDTSKPSCINQPEPSGDQPVSSRRLKKREVDRRCQREARERRRSRIADLEQLVEAMRQRDASGEVTALLKQLKSVEAERDMAMRTLRDIQQIMFLRPLKLSDPPSQGASFSFRQVSPGESNRGSGFIESAPGPSTREIAYLQNSFLETSALANDGLSIDNTIPGSKATLDFPDIPLSRGIVGRNNPLPKYQAFTHTKHTGGHHTTESMFETYNWINARQTCCCYDHVERQPGQYASWQGNFWKFIRDILSERFDWEEDLQPADDVESEDLPIRAMLEGWDAVAKRGPLHPSWQMLRRIDESSFGPIPRIERLAMLRAMHLLIQFHTDPSPQRHKRLPPWYIYRPSEHIEHCYAIDYYAWPPFRQQFILNEHAYCGNDFFRLYQDQMRLLWPFDFRQCYTQDSETGMYRPSLLFDQTINDIKCWTMGPDFFQRFPELSGAIPNTGLQVQRPLAMPTVPRKMGLPTSGALPMAIAPMSKTVLNKARKQPRGSRHVEAEDDQTNVDPGIPGATLAAQVDQILPIMSEPHYTQGGNIFPSNQSHIFQEPAGDVPFEMIDGSLNPWDFDSDFLNVNTFPSVALDENNIYLGSEYQWVQQQASY